MGKHSKNYHAAPTFRASERAELKKHWGKAERRLGAASFKDFDHCSICLHAAVEPLACPKGHLFCKECIYESLMAQKEHQKRQMRLFEEQVKAAEDEKRKTEAEEKAKEAQLFAQLESGILPSSGAAFSRKAQNVDASLVPAGYEAYETADGRVYVVDRNLVRTHSEASGPEAKAERKKYLPCYWIPSLTPEPGQAKLVTKPSTQTCCPEGKHVLRVKHLRPVRFTPAPAPVAASAADRERGKEDAKAARPATDRSICPSCRNGFTNASKLGCLKPCGHVLCMQCVSELVLKDGACVDCGAPCTDKDVIRLQSGGTGFAATGAVIAQKQLTPAPLM